MNTYILGSPPSTKKKFTCLSNITETSLKNKIFQTYKKLERWHEYSSLLLLYRLRPNKLTTNQKFTEKMK
jgi:hypothetical protein